MTEPVANECAGNRGGEDERTREFELAIPSSPDYLSLLRSNVAWLCERCELSETESSRTVLAAVEAATNIMRHAYDGDCCHTIVLRGSELDDGLELEFLDRGRCVEPREVRPPELDESRPGGLGVHLIQSCVDQFEYEHRTDGDGARLVLRKFRATTPADGVPDETRGSEEKGN